MMRECAICGKPFDSNYPTAKYCSDACKKEAYRLWVKNFRDARDAEYAKTLLTCPICGKQFPKEKGKRQVYCSRECKKVVDAKNKRKYKEKQRAETKLNKMVYKAVTTGERQDISKMQEVLDGIALDENLTHDFKALDRAISKSVKVRRKQNMVLLAQDIVEADRLGMSYGQYQAMRERNK